MGVKAKVVTSVTVRVCTPDDGPLLHELFLESGKWEIPSLDWSQDMTPFWLIAELWGEPVGCLMVRAGRPFGSLEMLCVPTDIPHKTKARIVKTLLLHGLETLRLTGAQVAAGILHDGLDGYEKVLTKRGAVKWFTGHVFIKRLM